jgi:hypothetical protein
MEQLHWSEMNTFSGIQRNRYIYGASVLMQSNRVEVKARTTGGSLAI